MQTNIIGEGAQYTVETLHFQSIYSRNLTVVNLQQKLYSGNFSYQKLCSIVDLQLQKHYSSQFTVTVETLQDQLTVETLQQSTYSRNYTVVNVQQKLYSRNFTVEMLQQSIYSRNFTVEILRQEDYRSNLQWKLCRNLQYNWRSQQYLNTIASFNSVHFTVELYTGNSTIETFRVVNLQQKHYSSIPDDTSQQV